VRLHPPFRALLGLGRTDNPSPFRPPPLPAALCDLTWSEGKHSLGSACCAATACPGGIDSTPAHCRGRVRGGGAGGEAADGAAAASSGRALPKRI